MPAVSPGAFPYVQRAIRQRDAGWLRAAVTTMAEETTWQNVAASCVLAPDTVRQRVQTRLARVRRYFGRSREVAANGGSDGGVSVRTATTLLPALHSLEMFEYVCAAVISTALSVFCGPMRPVSVLSTAAVERRLPALGSNAACPSRSPAVRVKGGVVTSNTSIATHTAAVALALTAEQLGVALCTYAPIVHLREQTATENNVPNGKRGSSAQEVQAGHGLTSWLVGPSVERTSAAGPSTIFVAHVRDALSAGSEVDRSGSRTPASASTPFLLRWLAPRTVITASSTTTPALVAHTQKGHAYEAAAVSTASSAAAVVYARSVVNCTGCDVDAVKTLFDGNARDAVPAAFAGYLTYSYLVAPADAVYAAPAAAQPEDHSHSTDATKAALTSPLSQSTRTTGLHFSSPRLSFASAMVLPWWDRCVLLGPSISPLPLLRRSENAVAAAGAAPDAFPQRGARGLCECTGRLLCGAVRGWLRGAARAGRDDAGQLWRRGRRVTTALVRVASRPLREEPKGGAFPERVAGQGLRTALLVCPGAGAR
ncbi:Glycerol-3-phosphate dehydrogenase-like protein [Leptomonas pyrrhocoris]|uniref:Glycerol-3-phosphate dehydrogenase-like protein n=1 Tax=Leptomonas pyrrhocoris TaxID=157538 RepID=A0A0M9FT25_LEPPY|nr:Glycerol-3-phosphate dehydrogenase-like protein [Leptomonas pyrrhocoris]XP_015653808.1 Glycerol-3-phosphate dehydrogenase-like protein [Leptomonas pyrrhocoris]KPA75368.1 Glycerol-3-phosphate dehydrogenase-like protein [Leptomonas pyrrhocoris]KPA75369.1 Glycerol-3-phosphate dehydrogenase-like protein [Leptomonas pyrrhocoris]|eukprot:XP_015653807.1 Glycerol-3-phosphate dehydrogenase-like protein [Leptomonas pyrrhocoris]